MITPVHAGTKERDYPWIAEDVNYPQTSALGIPASKYRDRRLDRGGECVSAEIEVASFWRVCFIVSSQTARTVDCMFNRQTKPNVTGLTRARSHAICLRKETHRPRIRGETKKRVIRLYLEERTSRSCAR